VTRVGERRTVHGVLVGKSEGRRPLGRLRFRSNDYDDNDDAINSIKIIIDKFVLFFVGFPSSCHGGSPFVHIIDNVHISFFLLHNSYLTLSKQLPIFVPRTSLRHLHVFPLAAPPFAAIHVLFKHFISQFCSF
jgi:hypothetical protein